MSEAGKEPPQGTEGYVAVLSFLGWSLAATIGPILPWMQGLLNYGLINEYFREKLDPVATVFAVAGFAWVFAANRRNTQPALFRSLRRWAIGAVGSIVTCIILVETVSVQFEPPWFLAVPVRLFWYIAYVSVFVCVSGFLCILALLYAPKRKKPTPNQSTPPNQNTSPRAYRL